MINELIIPRPDDMHLHLREGEMLKVVSQHSANQFGRAIIMPNLKNPVINTELANIYYDEIKKHTKSHQFEPLMTIYFNEGLTLEELKKIKLSSKVIGIKLYPKVVTTNSSNIEVQNALRIMLNELSLNQSVKLVSQIFKMKKNEIYNLALGIKNNDK